MSEPRTLILSFDSSTKGTHKFRPDKSDSEVTDLLYLKKDFSKKMFGSDVPPNQILLTISSVEEQK